MRHTLALTRSLRRTMLRRPVDLLGLTWLLCLLPFVAHAASCGVSTTGLAFDAYDPFSELALDSAATITVTCDGSVSYSVALSGGTGGLLNRYMSGPGHQLRYDVFLDVPRMVVWGDGSASTSVMSGSGPLMHHTVYARVPARQNVRAGLYGDSLVITVHY